jgi:DNA (cytosine-5)-methyltransferase 1
MHDTGGVGSVGDITDKPSPTVTVGNRQGNTYHWQVHGGPGPLPVYDDKGVPHDPETGQRIALPGSPQPGLERRRLTLGELRAIGGFPPDFVLTGSYAQRWERIGRAVPPVMMAAIAATVRDKILVPAREAGRT